MPLGHWNWKWNQARSNYSTYDQELLAGMLVLSSQSRLLGSNPIVWLCDQEPVKPFQKGPPPEKAKLKRWWTYLSQFRLTVHHIPRIKNELSDYISRNNFDALIGESSEALAKEAFQRMDVQLDLSMRTTGEAGSDPRGHLGVTWGVYLCAGKPPLADIILSHPPDLTRCDSVIGLAIPALSGHIQNRGTASGDLYIGISGINRVLLS